MTEVINYWLMKSEPDVYGINHLKEESYTLWDGIRNYQARNFMRQMKEGDQAFFYHSNCNPPCITGLMEVTKTGIIDPTQFDKSSNYFDPKSTQEKPKWDCVELKFVAKFIRPLSLEELKQRYSSEQLPVVKKGNRLSITKVPKDTAKDLLINLGKFEK